MSNRSPRRLAVILMTPEIFMEAFRHGVQQTTVPEQSLPKDARFFSVVWDRGRDRIALTLESESFDLVAPGDPLPDWPSPLFGTLHE